MGVYRLILEDVLEPLLLSARVSATLGQIEALRQLGRTVPPPIAVRFVLDNGSRHSTLAPIILQQLQCVGIGRVRLQTAMGQVTRELYTIRIEFPSGTLAPLPEVRVASLEMPSKLRDRFQGVLGRDILSRWDVCSSGLRHRLTIRDRLSFWSWLCS